MNIDFKNVKFLDELVDYLYENKSYTYRADKMRELIDPSNSGKGRFWELVVEKAMAGRANLLKEANAKGRDMDDNTDMKFVTFTSWKSDGWKKVATVGVENKIGPLRICLVYPGQDRHKVYFMFVPSKAHINRNSNSPVKIYWSIPKSRPTGEWWDRYRCSFADVLQSNPELVSFRKPIVDQISFNFGE